MKKNKILYILFFIFSLCIATKTKAVTVPLYKNLGDYHYPVSTKSERAQQYFDQAMVLAFGFNHLEAARSFREAARIDPEFAMAYWGVGLVLGPNINASMAAESVSEAYNSVQRALHYAEKINKKEQALIQALSKRYSPKPAKNRNYLDNAYADAMHKVAQQYPDDATIQSLFAEALMDLHPWDYWTKDGNQQPWTQEILANLESALDHDPINPLANHLYIHAVEASPNPEKALGSARRLETLVPGIGHLVHMPAHIYIRTGRYNDAIKTNEKALKADKSYIAHSHPDNPYLHLYNPHDDHFIAAAATMDGQSELAIKASRQLAEKVSKEVVSVVGSGTGQHFYSIKLYTLVKFGKWEDIFKEPVPTGDLKYPIGIWHYARGMAYVRTGQKEKAKEELKKLNIIASDPSLKDLKVWDMNTLFSILNIAKSILNGEIAASLGNYNRAIEFLEHAVQLEDALRYDEPQTWPSPVRETLGAVLLEAGKAAYAERVFQEDLKRYPENGWALTGLYQSLKKQGKEREAEEVKNRFEKAWSRADVKIISSRF